METTYEPVQKWPKNGGRLRGVPNKRTKSLERRIDRACRKRGFELVPRLAELAQSKDPKVALSATMGLMAYRFGRPKESLELGGAVDLHSVVAQARARVLAFEQRTAQAAATPAAPPAAPSFAAWKSENGLDPPTPAVPPESEDVERGKIRRVVMQ